MVIRIKLKLETDTRIGVRSMKISLNIWLYLKAIRRLSIDLKISKKPDISFRADKFLIKNTDLKLDLIKLLKMIKL